MIKLLLEMREEMMNAHKEWELNREKQELESPTEGRAKPLRFQVDEQELEQARKVFSNLKDANGENYEDNSRSQIENSIEEELKGQTCGEAKESI